MLVFNFGIDFVIPCRIDCPHDPEDDSHENECRKQDEIQLEILVYFSKEQSHANCNGKQWPRKANKQDSDPDQGKRFVYRGNQLQEFIQGSKRLITCHGNHVNNPGYDQAEYDQPDQSTSNKEYTEDLPDK